MSQLEYIFPLRPDFNVQIIVPQDLTTLEAQRLAAFLLTLAVPQDEEPEDREDGKPNFS